MEIFSQLIERRSDYEAEFWPLEEAGSILYAGGGTGHFQLALVAGHLVIR